MERARTYVKIDYKMSHTYEVKHIPLLLFQIFFPFHFQRPRLNIHLCSPTRLVSENMKNTSRVCVRLKKFSSGRIFIEFSTKIFLSVSFNFYYLFRTTFTCRLRSVETKRILHIFHHKTPPTQKPTQNTCTPFCWHRKRYIKMGYGWMKHWIFVDGSMIIC